MTPITTLEDLHFDDENANAGTLRGEQFLEHSLSTYGAGRSIVVDKHGVVIGGNKTLQLAIEAGLVPKVVPSDGSSLVVVVRTDLDLATDPRARMLAYLDNRAAEVGLRWKPEQLAADLAAGVDLSRLFTTAEVEDVMAALADAEAALEPTVVPDDAPVPVPEPNALTGAILFDTPAQQAQWLAAVQVIGQNAGETFADQLTIWLASQLEALGE